MRYKYALFDLDGTLTDPYEGITKSVLYALGKMNIEPPKDIDLKQYIGPPLYYSFTHFNDMNNEQAHETIKFFRERYTTVGLYENALLPDTVAALKKMRDSGITLAVATSKLENIAVRVLTHFGIDEYFTLIAGALSTDSRSEKGEVVKYALETLGVADKTEAVMIGDRYHDIDGARENDIDSIGVLCGYGDREELNKAGADYVFDNLADLADFITAE